MMNIATISNNDAQKFSEMVKAFGENNNVKEKYFSTSSVAVMGQQPGDNGVIEKAQAGLIILTVYSCLFFFEEVKQLEVSEDNGER